MKLTKQEALKKIEELKAFIEEEDKVEWPTLEDKYWLVGGVGTAWRIWKNDTLDKNNLETGNCFRTKEDATLMGDWIKAQRFTWMPEFVKRYWWSDWEGNPEEQVGVEPSSMAIAFGNVHPDKESAEKYGELMRKVAAMKKGI